MSTWALLAPGPSASAAVAARVAHLPIGAIGCAHELAPSARFIAASDIGWWRKYPEARAKEARKFCMGHAFDVEWIRIDGMPSIVNSGVLGLECARRLGATTILLSAGFDMHGTHFFGPYTNGLRPTSPEQREQHHQQYVDWWRANRKKVAVINCTEGSALQCFPRLSLDEALCDARCA